MLAAISELNVRSRDESLTVEDTSTSAASACCSTPAAMWTATPATSLSALISISPVLLQGRAKPKVRRWSSR